MPNQPGSGRDPSPADKNKQRDMPRKDQPAPSKEQPGGERKGGQTPQGGQR